MLSWWCRKNDSEAAMSQPLDSLPPRQRLRQLAKDKPESFAQLLQAWLHADSGAELGKNAVQAAVIFMALESDNAKQLLRLLEPADIKLLIKSEAATEDWDEARIEVLLDEFSRGLSGYHAAKRAAGKLAIRELVQEEFGEETSSLLAMNLDLSHPSSQIKKLEWLDAEVALQLIADEHPQVQAALLACLPVSQARELLSLFDTELAEELLLRLSSMRGLSPLAVAELDYLLEHKMSSIEGRIHRPFSGEQHVTHMLKGVPLDTESRLLAGISQYRPKSAERIQDALVDFEQIADLSNLELGRLLGWFGNDALGCLLEGLEPSERQRFIAALPYDRQQVLRARKAEASSPVNIAVVKKELVSMAKQMAAAGELVLGVERLA